ncbi:DUF349 domain-containing protein [Marinilabiliaceae bacterium JC017]|nr:DUF349 domain-containing protein [Marinilabiliaceae bacterium JC017]
MEAKDLNKSTENGMDLNSEHNTENTLQNPPAEENADTRSSSDQNSETSTPKKEEPKEEPVVNETEAAETANQTEEKKEAPAVLEPVDHIMLSKEKLVERFKSVLKDFPVDHVRDEVEAIKSAFYKKHKAEVEDLKKKFVESGELEENFAPPIDHLELEIKELLKKFRENKAEFNRRIEAEKEKNYQIKLSVIEGIKALINRQESLNETFQEFRELQNKWHEAGPVPQDKLRDLWQTYNYHIENFYNYIKINKELRDLDLKKNMKAKLELCEKAENLLLEPTIVKAFKTLQKFHEQWREIGPVPHDKKDELWARFKEATSKINKRHQDYFEGLKDQLQKNLQAKTELCEKAETIAELRMDNPKEWEAKSKDLIELQQIWKTIGFAPKKDNNTIYDRFRTACDKFFDNKREYFKDYKSEQQNNLQLKTELCIQAEGMKDNKDWRKTTDEFIAIQRKWKEIGPVPRKHSDAIWKRFRTACDAFFENKSNFFNHIDEEHDHNLVLKQELIEEVKAYNPSEDSEENFKHLQEFQRRWSDIGHVPLKDKDHINQEFRNLINQYFDNLNMDEFNKSLQKFRNKLENIKSSDNRSEKFTQERNKIINKLKQLESDITLWENNIGFFAKSKKSDALVKDFNHKIENGKRNIKLLNRKLDMLDKLL